ncbi:N-terminal EF-hand calcium-binding protein 3 isoform X3 [Mesocricetus auratus]|uniref:N-terminal EF-hand calcium-binding protein 3 isoform X3 n=1 Tax=Mesocricetus auratus TaxID=10036 RepID=A0ABM2WDG1_MESAU|nr:N-terminal EF-hand calcium-binding protein 3 isoform X3 [Mesocricetus auratus]
MRTCCGIFLYFLAGDSCRTALRRSSAEQTRMMTASSHLKSSRVTLRTGFSARWSCGSCSAALMDTSPNNHVRLSKRMGTLASVFSSLGPGSKSLKDVFSFPHSNLETEKLCDYFSKHLGVYRPVLAALESLNRAVLTAMDTTKLEYEQASKVDQFVTRFLLRETVNQLQALQSSLEGASDTLEVQARGQRCVSAVDLWLDEENMKVQRRFPGSRQAGRRALRSISWSPTCSPRSADTGWNSEAELQWRLQVNRLQELIDQLECKAPRLEPLHEEDCAKGPDSHILVAQRQVQVAEDALQDFHRALCCYMNFTGAQSHCLHVSAEKMLDHAAFTLYEFWQDEASWRRHQQSPCSKAFQRTLIDHLRAPDTLTTVFFPASWWIVNNN